MKTFVRKTVSMALSALMALLPIVSCSGSNPTNSPAKADITLTGTNDQVTRQMVGQYDAMTALAKNPGQTMRIAIAGSNADPVIVKFGFNQDGKPILTRPDGQQARLELGLDGIKPVVRLIELRSGKILAQQAIEPNAAAKTARTQQASQSELVQAGMVAVGAAIIAWLGLKAIELTVVGIGYLALVGLVAGAAVIASGVMANVFKSLGWDADDFINLFRQSFNDLAAIISGAIKKFQETYNVG